jgi:hypothetical protein
MTEKILKLHSELFKPNSAELKLLNEHENIKFEIIPSADIISEGRQSRVSILEYQVGSDRRRVLWKRMGAGKNLTEDEACRFKSRLGPYRADMIRCGWKVPVLFYTTVVKCDNEFQIFSYEQFIPGGDGEKMILNPKEPNFRKWFLLRRVVEILATYSPADIKKFKIDGQQLSLLPHGLDLKLANVVLDANGNLFFVDLFGPKELDERGEWLTYSDKLDSLPQKNLLAVCATREGALLRLYRLIELKWITAGGPDMDRLRDNFFNLLNNSRLPQNEIDFIVQEVRNDYPLLDRVYSEASI